jgi:ABC-type glycerol-3-phosphate transport system permease component
MIVMIIPIVGSLPSSLHLYRDVLHLYNSWAFIVVTNITISGGTMLIFYAFFLGIGNEYAEAAKIDGAGNFTIMMKIIFPLTAQMFFIMCIQAFIPLWNDYMGTVIWFPSIPTLAYGIFYFTDATSTLASWPPIQIAGCIILMIPLLVLFLAFKDKLMGNIRMGGVKM